MTIKTNLVLACTLGIVVTAAVAVAVAPEVPPPPGSLSGTEAPTTAGNDSTLSWHDGTGPQSSSITIAFPASGGSTGGGGGGCAGGCGFTPPQPVPIGSGVQLGINNANSSVYWPLPAGIPNSTSGSYGPGGNLAGNYTPVTYISFSGTFQWYTASGAPVSVDVAVGDHAAGSACTADNEGDAASETCTKTVTIGDARWLFTVTGGGPTAHGCVLPPPPRTASCRLTVHGSVAPAP